jgi:hypothetical protein
MPFSSLGRGDSDDDWREFQTIFDMATQPLRDEDIVDLVHFINSLGP